MTIKFRVFNGQSRRVLFNACGLIWLCSLEHIAFPDLFHYNNLLIGPRAMGLGGAFTAISNDTSGLFYNPGGLAFQSSAELSTSINTYYLKNNKYENVFGDKEFEESARGTVSTFFGFSKIISPPILGQLHVGIAFVNPDAALSDENVLIENEPAPSVIRYHRTANIRSGRSQVIAGVAKRFGKQTGLGCAGSYLDVDELEQTYQDVVQGPFTFKELPDTSVYSTLGQNLRTHLVLRGGSVKCGFRSSLNGGLLIGASYQKTEMVFQKLEQDLEINKVFTDLNNQVIEVTNTSNPNLKGQLLRSVSRSSDERFLTSWPDELRVGIAYQPSNSFLVSADVMRHGDGDGTITQVKKSEVINYALGAEIIVANSFFLRSGFFTNRDATATRDISSPNQRKEYLDYKGASLATGLKLRSGEYAIHYTEQRGSGMAEKVSGKVEASTGRLQVISISASQSFQ